MNTTSLPQDWPEQLGLDGLLLDADRDHDLIMQLLADAGRPKTPSRPNRPERQALLNRLRMQQGERSIPSTSQYLQFGNIEVQIIERSKPRPADRATENQLRLASRLLRKAGHRVKLDQLRAMPRRQVETIISEAGGLLSERLKKL